MNRKNQLMPPFMRTAVTRLRGSLNPEISDHRYTDWPRILGLDGARWKSALAAAKCGPAVLITNSAGFDPHAVTVDSLLAVALTLRGANVHILLCDEALPACWMTRTQHVPPHQFVESGPSEKICGDCFLPGYKVFRSLGLPIHRYSTLTSREDLKRAQSLSQTVPLDEIKHFRLDGIEIGEHALGGALRYYTRGDLRDEPDGEAVLRRYFSAALLSALAVRRLLSTIPFRSACGIHGIYVPEGLICEVARSQNVRMVSWCDAYRRQSFIFSHYDTYHRTMLSEPTNNWENMRWTPEMESEILDYLKSRWYGTHDWIKYNQDWSEDVSSIAAGLGIDATKPCIGLLTNVLWDAQVHYGENAFSNMLDWILQTIKYFANRPDLQLIVRVHPAEVRNVHKSRQRVVDEIKRGIPNLPKNVFVIPPDSPMNTYAAMARCNAVIIYGTKTGVELASFGIPVIVAGEAWVRNKGMTIDVHSVPEYFEILSRLPLRERMSDTAIQRARKYAYHFFFRRMIPFPFVEETTGEARFKLKISGVEDLLPGRYPGLDVVCDGITKGDEFIYPAEMYPQRLATTGKFTSSYSAELPVQVNNKPLVSVVIPTQNHGDSLRNALDSVYAQSGVGNQFDLEVILVDNASSDSTSQAASDDPRVRYIGLPSPIALSAVRNVGLKASKGQYVAFLDDDNVWLPERIRSHVAVLERYPQFGAAYGQFIAIGDGEDSLYPEGGDAPAGSVFRAFSMEEFTTPSYLTARREAFQQAGYFDENLCGMESYEMLLRLAHFVPFAFVAGAFGKGRFSYSAIWSGRIQRGEHQTELPYILNKALGLLPDSPETVTLKREVITHWFTKIAHCLDKPETVELLRSHLLNWIQQYPWMMADPPSQDSMVNYASKVLSRMLEGDASFNHPALTSFCHEVKSAQNGNFKETASQTQRFLGDTLTRTSVHMLDRGRLKAAGYTATYAIRQDTAQIIRQLHGTSRRLIRVLFPAAS